MSTITTFVDPAAPSWADQLGDRCRRAAVAARIMLATVVAWARGRVEAARADQRGFETAEIVVIGSILVVIVGTIATGLGSWLTAKLGDITKH